MTQPLSSELLQRRNAYWRAANYLSVGQLYLFDNPLLKEPLKIEHVKPRQLGHWGTTAGLNFIYVHLNRNINKHDRDVARIVTGDTVSHPSRAVGVNEAIVGVISRSSPCGHTSLIGIKAGLRDFRDKWPSNSRWSYLPDSGDAAVDLPGPGRQMDLPATES